MHHYGSVKVLTTDPLLADWKVEKDFPLGVGGSGKSMEGGGMGKKRKRDFSSSLEEGLQKINKWKVFNYFTRNILNKLFHLKMEYAGPEIHNPQRSKSKGFLGPLCLGRSSCIMTHLSYIHLIFYLWLPQDIEKEDSH